MTQARTKPKWSPWPYALTAWFVFLIALCVWLVFKSLGLNHDLVSKDYYAQSLDHDQFQQAISRTRKLEDPPRIDLMEQENLLAIHLPESASGAVLHLYRPANANMDLKFQLQDHGVASAFSTQKLHPGRWQAKIVWHEGETLFIHQEDLFIP